MNDIMSYQYPSPGTPPPPYHAGYPVGPHATGMGIGSPDRPGRHGSSTIPYDLKRSDSHSRIRMEPPTPGSDEAKMTAAEKKRNKLGYHRATTACTCCRHRKIRCQPGPPGQKCKMCEKLNKECKFESVSHQGPPEPRHPSASRVHPGHRMVSGVGGHPVDMHGAHHVGMTMPPIQHIGLTDPPDLKMGPGSLARSAYPEYNSQGIASNWAITESAAGPGRAKHGSWGPYGHDSSAPALGPSPFPPYNHTTPPPSGTPGWAEPSSRSDMPWSSYPPPQQAAGQQPFSPISQLAGPASGSSYDRKTPASTMPPVEMYPPLPTMAPEPHSGPSISSPGPAAQPAGYGGWQPQGGYAPVPNKPGEGYAGGWHSHAGGDDHGAQVSTAPALPVSEGYYAQR